MHDPVEQRNETTRRISRCSTAIGSRYSAASASGTTSRGLATHVPTCETMSPHKNPISPPSANVWACRCTGVACVQHVVRGLDVDHDLRQRVGGHREVSRRGGFDEQAGTEVEWRCWHVLQQIYRVALSLGGRTPGREIDLANGADVVGEVGHTAHDAVELGLLDLARLLERLEPAMRLVRQLIP